MPENDTAAVDAAPEAPRRTGGDPVARWMGYVAAALVVLILTAIIFILWNGLTPKAPRTLTEQRLMAAEIQVMQEPNNVTAWTAYMQGLIETRQYSKALKVIDHAESTLGKVGVIELERGRLLIAEGRTDDAIKTLTAASKLGDDERKRKVEEQRRKGVETALPSSVVRDVQVMLADVYADRKDWKAAIAAYTTALKEDPQMADILAARGDAYRALGDEKAAKRDYEAALRFTPDLKAALDGIAKLKAVGK